MKQFNLILILFILISTITVVILNTTSKTKPTILGSETTAAKLYDDSNGTLYLEYTNPQDVYKSISSWQGKYPGRTIYSSSALSSFSTKYSSIIFTYTGR